MQIRHEESVWPLATINSEKPTKATDTAQGNIEHQPFVPATHPEISSPAVYGAKDVTPSGSRTSSQMAPEVTRHLIQTTQAEAVSPTNTDGLPEAQRHGLEDIANAPDYAAMRARQLGTGHVLGMISEADFPKNGDPDAVWNAFALKTNVQMALADDLRQQRSALYDSLVEKGVPPAEIYAELLGFQARLPETVIKNQGYTTNSNTSWSEWNTVASNYLKQAIVMNDGLQSQGGKTS